MVEGSESPFSDNSGNGADNGTDDSQHDRPVTRKTSATDAGESARKDDGVEALADDDLKEKIPETRTSDATKSTKGDVAYRHRLVLGAFKRVWRRLTLACRLGSHRPPPFFTT
ncbi:MAG: hypothetical protein P1V19_01250 [Gimesia sp.]|nr:hypothetical protein [Gimesia sp.]